MNLIHLIRTREQDEMLSRLFFRLLPVQAALIAVGSLNSIIDGVVAGRFIGTAALGVIGLYYAMLRILEATGSVLLGGVTVLSGRSLGSGRIDRTRGITSLGLALALLAGSFLTVVSLAAPGALAELFGTSPELKGPLITYIRGYAFGIIPQLLGQQFASTLQLERKEKRGHAAVFVMFLCNLSLDLLFVVVWDMGIWGLALATSIANWAYFLVTAQYYFTREAQLKPGVRLIAWSETLPVVKIGSPNALLVVCLGARSLVINRILLSCSGSAGLSALASFNILIGLILAVSLGSGALLRMLASVFLGEHNRESLRALIRLLLTRVMALLTAIAVLVIILAPFLAGIFCRDSSSEAFRLTKQLFILYSLGIPAAQGCIIISNYFQAAGRIAFTSFISVMDGFVSTVVPALILGPLLGAAGVWLAFLAGLFITLGASLLYPVLQLKRLPRSLDEWMLLPPEFGSAPHLVLKVENDGDVTRTAELVQEFCSSHGLPRRIGTHAGLCLEEMAGNIVRHGFSADSAPHHIEVRVILTEEGVTLRIRDDCIPFNPEEWHAMTMKGPDPTANVGIRLVYGLASRVEYQNLLGLNVLTILLADPSQAKAGGPAGEAPA